MSTMLNLRKISANGNDLIYVSKNVLHEDEDLEVGDNNLLLQQ